MVKKILVSIVILIAVFSLISLIPNNSDELDKVSKPHYTKTNISYSIYVNSSIEYENKTYKANDTYKEKQIHKAFKLVENASNGQLTFHEIPNTKKADIDINAEYARGYCENIFPYYYEETDITNGWGEIVEAYTNGEIHYSEITFCPILTANHTTGEVYNTWELEEYKSEYPNTEVHEILHTLGFDHKNETCHIMNPYQQTIDCDNIKIDKDISNCLEYIYSNTEKSSCLYQNFMI